MAAAAGALVNGWRWEARLATANQVHADTLAEIDRATTKQLQAQQEQGVILPLLTNNPGLLFDTAFNMTGHTRWRMSAVNWLTAIRGDLLELCGGPEAVLAQLTRPGFETKRYGESGLFVQAGPSPQLGNLEADLMLPHYGDLARALKPARLRIDGGRRPHVAYYGPEEVLYSEELMAETQNAWLARFDDMR